MDIFETRRSIRKFTDQPVTDETVLALIEAARVAPSGRNLQPWNFVVVRSEEMKAKIDHAEHDQGWIAKAPVLIVCVADGASLNLGDEVVLTETTEYKEQKLVLRDTAVAAEHIILKAVELGLGTCWTGLFTQKDIRDLLGIPGNKHVVGILAIGYPDPGYEPRPRKLRPIEDMVRYERW